MRIVKQTDEEKLAMYMKYKKKELAEMLIECNKQLDVYLKKYNDIKAKNDVQKSN